MHDGRTRRTEPPGDTCKQLRPTHGPVRLLNVVRALVLGLVQGLTEFLPVSSSAHLVLVPYFAGWSRPGLAFDVALHFGTLSAVIWHFRSDLVMLTRSLLGGDEHGLRLLTLLVVASAPVALVGATLETQIARVFSAPSWTAWLLLVMAFWLLAGERSARRPGAVPIVAATHEEQTQDTDGVGGSPGIGWSAALVIGVAQAAALLPGISRSGSTIATGLLLGVDRQTAARFSFLLSIPAIVGAISVELPNLAASQVAPTELTAGVIAAFVSGLWAIRWLLRIISTRGLTGFAVYLALLATVVLTTGRG